VYLGKPGQEWGEGRDDTLRRRPRDPACSRAFGSDGRACMVNASGGECRNNRRIKDAPGEENEKKAGSRYCDPVEDIDKMRRRGILLYLCLCLCLYLWPFPTSAFAPMMFVPSSPVLSVEEKRLSSAAPPRAAWRMFVAGHRSTGLPLLVIPSLAP
jgi:hypothetical protein